MSKRKTLATQKLEDLTITDIYSLVLFAIYKLGDVPEYSSLSELSYLLDKKSFFNLIEYYGGTTIKIPTQKEFKKVLNSLLLYQLVNLEGIEFTQAFKLLDDEYQVKATKDEYFRLVEILEKHNFKREEEERV